MDAFKSLNILSHEIAKLQIFIIIQFIIGIKDKKNKGVIIHRKFRRY